MDSLNRDAILAANDVKVERVEVPEWGGHVFVRLLSGTERDAFEQSNVKIKGKQSEVNLTNIRARLAVLCVCDETGARLFKDADATALGAKSGAVLDRIFDAASALNKIGKAQQEQAEGNSEPAQSE